MKKHILLTLLGLFYYQLMITAQTSQVYMADSGPTDIDFIGDTMYFVTHGEINGPISKLMKIENLDGTPQISTVFSNIGTYPRAIEVVNNNVYFSTSTYLRKIDFDSGDLTPMNVVYAYGIKSILHKDGILYLAEDSKISKIDLSQIPISKVDIYTNLEYAPLSLANYGDEIYVAYGYKISKFNITSPAPALVDVVSNLPSKIYGMDVNGDELYFDQTWPFVPNTVHDISKINLADATTNVINLNLSVTANMGALNFHNNNIYLTRAVTKEILKIDENVLSLPDNEPAFDLKLCPNPCSDDITVLNNALYDTYVIYDLLGNELSSGNVNLEAEINIQFLSKGLYILAMKENNKSFKFLKK